MIQLPSGLAATDRCRPRSSTRRSLCAIIPVRNVTIGTSDTWETLRHCRLAATTVTRVKATFTKLDRGRYGVAITRDHGPEIIEREAAGYDEYMPRDLAHFLVESHFGIRLGVIGHRLAVGGGFQPGASQRSARARRAAHRTEALVRDDTSRAERLVELCQTLWEVRAGRTPSTPPMIDMSLTTPFEVDWMMHRFDEVSAQWHALQPGEAITLEWPAALRDGDAGGDHAHDRRAHGARIGSR